jgi:hypothetical protein
MRRRHPFRPLWTTCEVGSTLKLHPHRKFFVLRFRIYNQHASPRSLAFWYFSTFFFDRFLEGFFGFLGIFLDI